MWSWSLSVGQLHSHLGNVHWEKIPLLGTTGASVKKNKINKYRTTRSRFVCHKKTKQRNTRKLDAIKQRKFWDTHINQCFVFLPVLEKIKNRLHVCLLQDKIVRIYREHKNTFKTYPNSQKWFDISYCSRVVPYIWYWLGCALCSASHSFPHQCGEEKVPLLLLEETLATVCHAWHRWARPSEPLLDSSCLRKSSLFWGGIQHNMRSFIDTDPNTLEKSVKVGCHLLFQDGHYRF